ncbi:MAG: YfcC family protein [Lachnospiraceae bacterium]|nr:YfcC family protein [Lachnospiraceae bacterium]
MEDTALKISKKTFLTSLIILLALMLFAGVLTQILPQGSYVREIADGREVVAADSYTVTEDGERLPFWKVFTAPFLVLFSSDGVTVLGIILFLMVISGDIALLNQSGVMAYSMQRIVEKNRGRRYRMLFVATFIFMAFGAFVGVFEESATLAPFAVALATAMGWDALVGLGMSMLAAGFGFAAAISNPFTLSIAQELAGLPIYSGFGFHVVSFLVIYLILAGFLYHYARSIDGRAEMKRSGQDKDTRESARQDKAGIGRGERAVSKEEESRMRFAMHIFLAAIGLVVAVVLLGILIPAVASNALVLMLLPMTVGSVLAAKKAGLVKAGKQFVLGITGMLPGVVMILMASSVKLIVQEGGILDTILYYVSGAAQKVGGAGSLFLIYGLILILNFFIASGSAKAFLVIPIIAPLADLVGITRQTAVIAYCFGDGFSNVLYPTNPVLLICLGMTAVSYGKWVKWTWKLQAVVLVVSGALLYAAYALQLGPF